jgi:hypothetical protein
MRLERPEYIDHGIAQFFCHPCTYRRDRCVGPDVAERYHQEESVAVMDDGAETAEVV